MEESLQEDSLYLTFEETRVLGSLIEKGVITPENYPLSLNSLVNACNQKTSRHPQSELSEGEVEDGLNSLRVKGLVLRVDLAGSRIPRYQHKLPAVLELDAGETALLTVLMLRGPQTVGELRSRVDRLHAFADLDDIENTLDSMRQGEPPLVGTLDPAPGQKETRHYHLLTDAPEIEEGAGTVYVPAPDRTVNQVDEMASEVQTMREEVDALRSELREFSDAFREFKKQFE